MNELDKMKKNLKELEELLSRLGFMIREVKPLIRKG
jgi:hypothetical protein